MLLNNAKWIYFEEKSISECGRYGGRSPYFRKIFKAEGVVKKAVIYVSAIGVFKAYINGAEVDCDYLSPGFTDYRRRIPYIEFDITEKIGTENAVAIVAGDGWAAGYLAEHKNRNNYTDRIEIIAAIVVEYTDGSKQYVGTDNTWKVSFGEIVRSDLYCGEYVDARLSLGNFSEYAYDDGGWHNANEVQGFHVRKSSLLDRAIAPNTVVKHRLKAQYMYTDKGGRRIYDFLQNMTGVARLRVKGERGAVVVLRHGEMLDADGTVYRDNLRTAEATDTYILAGVGEEVFRPLFTFHGFRYLDVEIKGEAEILEITGEVMYSDLKSTADFSCSDETVNRLYKNIVWSQRDNFLNIPTDCPQRDERLGWTGDTQVFCGTAMFNMDCRDFYKKHLADIRDAAFGNGGIPGIAPVIPLRYVHIQGRVCAGWADVITVLPYEHYRMYGDAGVVRDNLPAAKNYIAFCQSNSTDFIRDAWDEYGDWLSVGEETDTTLIATAFFAHSAMLTSKLCGVIGDRDEEYYYGLYCDIKAAFRKRFFKNEKLFSDTQTAYLMAYTFGLLTADEVRVPLITRIKANNKHLSTGFLGVKYLLPVLCEIGETELAYTLLTNKTCPSWCYSVINGATTIWEHWDSYTAEFGINKEKMNSFNHYAYGSVGEWMFKYCLGIMPDESREGAGFKKVRLRPFVDTSGKFTGAKGYFDSVCGKIEAEWQREKGGYLYAVMLPEGITAEYDFGNMTATQLSKNTFLLKN